MCRQSTPKVQKNGPPWKLARASGFPCKSVTAKSNTVEGKVSESIEGEM